ncbi:MAG: polyphosphate polymerase domain-containing protein [Bacteroidales bacterium]|nr:polyphosphate polymerase domain-containing protein [Bacteroidales bacterium]
MPNQILEKNFHAIREVLQNFEPIGLEQMKGVKLMNRIDTKYVIPLPRLVPLLQIAAPDYYVQCTDGKRTAGYHTIYLDTADHRMYNLHEAGRKVRQKIRIREYLDTHNTFLEVKKKNNHGRTKKKRIEVPDCRLEADTCIQTLPSESSGFIAERSDYRLSQLMPHVENRFERITLVNRAFTERLTIDLGVRFHNDETNSDADIGHLVIIELKRDGATFSPMYNLLVRMHIHPGGFSKYCIGCALTNPQLRRNNFKEKLHRIERLKEQ